MEGHAISIEPIALGMLENVGGELGGTAEFAGQRPVGPLPIAKDAAEDLRARRRPRNLVDLGLGVDGEQPDAELMGARCRAPS